jgi:aryl-alcohol dehydrogenase-like predicted oxidoreductase
LLTGKYNDGIPAGTRATIERYAWLRERLTDPAALEKVRALGAIAAELDVTLAQMSIAWLLKNPHVSSVITGASRMEQLRDNLAALEALPKLSPEVMERIAGIIGEGE